MDVISAFINYLAVHSHGGSAMCEALGTHRGQTQSETGNTEKIISSLGRVRSHFKHVKFEESGQSPVGRKTHEFGVPEVSSEYSNKGILTAISIEEITQRKCAEQYFSKSSAHGELVKTDPTTVP